MGGQGCDRSAEPVEREDKRHKPCYEQDKLRPVEMHMLRGAWLTDCNDADDSRDDKEWDQNREHPTPADRSHTDAAHSWAERRGNRADHVADAHQQAQT